MHARKERPLLDRLLTYEKSILSGTRHGIYRIFCRKYFSKAQGVKSTRRKRVKLFWNSPLLLHPLLERISQRSDFCNVKTNGGLKVISRCFSCHFSNALFDLIEKAPLALNTGYL
jgi:hypothetical protein